MTEVCAQKAGDGKKEEGSEGEKKRGGRINRPLGIRLLHSTTFSTIYVRIHVFLFLYTAFPEINCCCIGCFTCQTSHSSEATRVVHR